jgi:hypothetical protein
LVDVVGPGGGAAVVVPEAGFGAGGGLGGVAGAAGGWVGDVGVWCRVGHAAAWRAGRSAGVVVVGVVRARVSRSRPR